MKKKIFCICVCICIGTIIFLSGCKGKDGKDATLVQSTSGNGGDNSNPPDSQPTQTNQPIQPPIQPPPTQPGAAASRCPDIIFTPVIMGQTVTSDVCGETVSMKFQIVSGQLVVDLDINTPNPLFCQTFYIAYPINVTFDNYQAGTFLGNAFLYEETNLASDQGDPGGVFYGCNKQPDKKVAIITQTLRGFTVGGITGSGNLGKIKLNIDPVLQSIDLIFAETALIEKAASAEPIVKKSCWNKNLRISLH